MAVGIPVPGVVLVRLKGLVGTQPWNNIYHLQYTGSAPSVADLQAVGTAIHNAWSTNFAPLAFTNVSLQGSDLADLTSPLASQVSNTFTFTGTRTGTALPNSTACVVSWQINVRYRGGHPRTYLTAGVAADIQAGGRLWTSAFVTSVNNAATAFRTALNSIAVSGSTYKMVSVSRTLDGAPRAQGVPYTINTNSVHGRVDTQRRRLGKETP